MQSKFDVIVVGARCAGAPTAMLLARRGLRVLVVDRATFPSDTLSTHIVQPRGVRRLRQWGLLEPLLATGCPPMHTHAFDFGAVVLAGAPGTADSPFSICPRRIVLDKLLVDAAAGAGAVVREGFTVESLLFEDDRVVGIRGHDRGGSSVEERAAVVVGADGWHSLVAAQVGAAEYHARPALVAAYYAYWSGLHMEGLEMYDRGTRGFGAAPTHDGLTMIIGGWPMREFEENRKDVEKNFMAIFDLVPEFAERVRGAKRESRFSGATIPNRFRVPFGPGWALAGDAGYLKDSITAQGISDAFDAAEMCSAALFEALTGAEPYGTALAAYQRARDEHAMPIYELTCQVASMQPPPPEMQALLASLQGNRNAMDRFAQMNAGTITAAEFMAAVTGPALTA